MEDKRIIMHVDMDAFFASCEEARDPSLKGKEIIIGSDPKEGKGRGVVSTCSHSARKYGIFSATPISIAYKKCPNAVYLRPDFKFYMEISRKIMLILRSYSVRFQQVGCDEAYLDVTEKVIDFADAKILAFKIKNEIFEKFNLTCSIGIADNKLVAKIASDHEKPDGITLVEDNKKFLDPLPIRKLRGIGKKTEPKILTLGIKTIGDLANYNREALMKRFGVYGLYLSLSAQGNGSDFVGYDHERCSISKERTFFEDTTNFTKIEETIEKIANGIYERLAEEKFVYKTISIKIRMEDFKTFTRSHTLHMHYSDKEMIEKTAISLTKEFVGNKIRLIGVRVSNLEKFKGQTTLASYA